MRRSPTASRAVRIAPFALAVLAVLAVGALGVGVAPTSVRAGEPPAGLTDAEAAEVARLVQDLGSADFRVREAATAALIGFGERARPALEAAAKSENPAVRFRADQLLAGLDGRKGERRLSDGSGHAEGAPGGGPGGGSGGGSVGDEAEQGFARALKESREAMEKTLREMRERWGAGRFDDQRDEIERRLREYQDDLERRFGAGPRVGPGPSDGHDWMRRWFDFGPQPGGRGVEVSAETDAHRLVLAERRNHVRLELRAKRDGESVATFSARSLDALLAAYPRLKDWPGVPDLLAKHEAAVKERQQAERERASRPGPAVANRSISIESGPGRVKVTVSETGPDGKPVTKTYEGSDLETLRQRHPELREALGGFTVHLGPLPRGFEPFVPGVPGGPPGFGDDHTPPQTGPFGLGLAEVDPVLRRHLGPLGLEAGQGALVAAVREGSDAAQLGLREGDVIVRVNDTAVKALGDVGTAVRAVSDGGALSIEVLREGKRVTLTR